MFSSPVRWFSLSLLALSLLLPGCSGDGTATSPPARPPVPVSVAQAVAKAVPVELRATGQVEANARVTVRSRVAGVLAAVHFREGDEVQKGDLLFTLDERPFQAALTKSEADLQQTRVEAENARRDAARYAQLLEAGFISREEADGVQAKAESLVAALAAAPAEVDNAHIALDYCTICAPQSGRTGALLAHPGTVVKANDAPDLVTISTLQPVAVAFSVPESRLSAIRRRAAVSRLAVTALAPGDPGPPESGILSFLDNQVDPATGTIRLKGTFANAAERLWPGQFVEVRLVLDTLTDAVVVPTAAVQTGQQGTYLWVLQPDGQVAQRPVVQGLADDRESVIEEGLAAGDTVVTEGQQRLSPGARVEVKTAAAITASRP